jgi:hypothetical protein
MKYIRYVTEQEDLLLMNVNLTLVIRKSCVIEGVRFLTGDLCYEANGTLLVLMNVMIGWWNGDVMWCDGVVMWCDGVASAVDDNSSDDDDDDDDDMIYDVNDVLVVGDDYG